VAKDVKKYYFLCRFVSVETGILVVRWDF
jgi:hypothetical protein